MSEIDKKNFLKQFTVTKLRSICKILELETTGTKNEIIERLSKFKDFDKVKESANIEIQSKKSKDIKLPPEKKYTKKNIPSAVRNTVWNTYVGTQNKEGTCLCCTKEKISFANFDCGHIVAEKNGGETTLENLRPICGHCNKSIGTQNMEDFISQYKFPKHKNWNGMKIQNNTNKNIESSDSSSDYTSTSEEDISHNPKDSIQEQMRKISLRNKKESNNFDQYLNNLVKK